MAVLRSIVGATVAIFIGVYIFWFIIPVSKTAYNTELASLNTSSTLMQSILPITNNWWVIFPLLIAVIIGWTVWQYSSGTEGFDY